MEDENQSKQVPWAPEVFGFCSNVPLYISQSDISEITNEHCMLNISILQLWLLFIHKLSVDKGNDHIYGFLEPELIQKIGNKTEEIQAYIQNWMSESNKKVYLVPYFSNAHWQLLIICPMDNISVCICSMHKPPPADFKQLLDKAMEGYHMLKGSKLKKKMLWVSLKSHKQKGNYEVFLTSLKRSTLTCYTQLPVGSVNNFDTLVRRFTTQYVTSWPHRITSHLPPWPASDRATMNL
ncbi:uncharacterized protein LOC114915929 [Cajanus cajan]|uniref:uncharacterized protein LOC114915929 n=1 Tax=Cajanus cajan TaxID=3821 RepID=UPI0010FB5CE7|nr:uncharacterized protein LOC114915929 [Cajanus cajan]